MPIRIPPPPCRPFPHRQDSSSSSRTRSDDHRTAVAHTESQELATMEQDVVDPARQPRRMLPPLLERCEAADDETASPSLPIRPRPRQRRPSSTASTGDTTAAAAASLMVIEERFLDVGSVDAIKTFVRGYTNHLSRVGRRYARERFDVERVGKLANRYVETLSAATNTTGTDSSEGGGGGTILKIEAFRDQECLAVINSRLNRQEEQEFHNDDDDDDDDDTSKRDNDDDDHGRVRIRQRAAGEEDEDVGGESSTSGERGRAFPPRALAHGVAPATTMTASTREWTTTDLSFERVRSPPPPLRPGPRQRFFESVGR